MQKYLHAFFQTQNEKIYSVLKTASKAIFYTLLILNIKEKKRMNVI